MLSPGAASARVNGIMLEVDMMAPMQSKYSDSGWLILTTVSVRFKYSHTI